MDLSGLLLGLLVGAAAALALTAHLRARAARTSRVDVLGGYLESLRRVGELVVLKAVYSVPATGVDHLMGEVGRRFLSWLWSENKTIMIFRFEIAFKYNLRDEHAIRFSRQGAREVTVQLGAPAYDINITDIRFWHTEQGRLLDWLLPKALNVFQSKMDDATRQQILEAAKQEARREADQLAASLTAEARQSAEAALTAICRGLGFEAVHFSMLEPGKSA